MKFVDPTGLFDQNTRLGYNPDIYNSDIQLMQQSLIDRGYDCGSAGADGYFGNGTLAALNQYKADNDLGNTGNDAGVVGAQTWGSLGLEFGGPVTIFASGKNWTYKIETVGNKRTITSTVGPIKTVETQDFLAGSGDVNLRGLQDGTARAGAFAKGSVITGTNTITVGNDSVAVGVTTGGDFLTGSLGIGAYASDGTQISIGAEATGAVVSGSAGVIVQTPVGKAQVGGEAKLGTFGGKVTTNGPFKANPGYNVLPYWKISSP